MTWPTSVNTANMDAGTDLVPRDEILSWAQKFNQLINHVSAFWQGVLDKTTASDAQTALGGTATGKALFTAADAAAVRTAAGATATGSSLMTAASGAAAFTAIKQAASDTATGVVELATTTEAAAGADTNRAVTPAGLEAHMVANALGWGQSWQNMLASRAVGTSYQNTSGRPVAVCIYGYKSSPPRVCEVSPDGSSWITAGAVVQSTDGASVSFVVPNGWYYRASSGISLYAWTELR